MHGRHNGIISAIVAVTAPCDRRGTAFGAFNIV
jgi:hypothetical protein